MLTANAYEKARSQASKMKSASQAAHKLSAGMANFWMEMSCTLNGINAYIEHKYNEGREGRMIINRLDAHNFRMSCKEMADKLKEVVECDVWLR